MSGAGVKGLDRPVAAQLARLDEPRTDISLPAETTIINAYLGGPGHEFTALIEKEVKNLPAVIAGFESGVITHYSVPGFTIKSPPTWQPGYGGFRHDSLALQAGGAVLLKGKKIELGAILRGPLTNYPGTTSFVFAINRGDGARLGPSFATEPGITPDALVTVTVGPDGKSNSATLTDLTTGSTQSISAPISVAASTVRILLPESLLPSKGFAVKNYRFAVWTETEPNAPIEDVGSFISEDSMTPIGVETNVSATF